jgi:hypothetical protein
VAYPKNQLCSVISRNNGDDPIGSATPFDGCLMVEVPPPWREDVADSKHFPAGLWDVVRRVWDAGHLGKFAALLPDEEHSVPDHTRVFYWRRPAEAFAAYEKEEFVVPAAELVPFLKSYFERPGELARFEEYRRDTASVRDLVVCTHGSRDVCCGRFGYPVYRELKRGYASDELRVWRSSHLGGHRFAPTLMDFPEGRYWGHVEEDALENIVRRTGEFAEAGRFYRGWAGLGSKFEQIAEREILIREGWRWTRYAKRGKLLEVDDEETAATVRIDFTAATGEPGAYEADIRAAGSVLTLASSGAGPLDEVTQYRVERLEKIS